MLIYLSLYRVSSRGLDDRAGWNPDHKRSSYVSLLSPDDLARSAGFQGAGDYFVSRSVVTPRGMNDEGVTRMWRALFPGMESWVQEAREVRRIFKKITTL